MEEVESEVDELVGNGPVSICKIQPIHVEIRFAVWICSQIMAECSTQP